MGFEQLDDIIVTSSDIGSIRAYISLLFLKEVQGEGKKMEELVEVTRAYVRQNAEEYSVKQALEEYGSEEAFSKKIIEGMLKAKSIRLEDGVYRANIKLPNPA